jgi:hypothetical protein
MFRYRANKLEQCCGIGAFFNQLMQLLLLGFVAEN